MTKTTLTFEFDIPEERGELGTQIHASDLYSANWEARQLIHTQLKHGELNEDVQALLEQIREILYVEGVE